MEWLGFWWRWWGWWQWKSKMQRQNFLFIYFFCQTKWRAGWVETERLQLYKYESGGQRGPPTVPGNQTVAGGFSVCPEHEIHAIIQLKDFFKCFSNCIIACNFLVHVLSTLKNLLCYVPFYFFYFFKCLDSKTVSLFSSVQFCGFETWFEIPLFCVVNVRLYKYWLILRILEDLFPL